MVATARREGVLQVRHPGARWLATGFDGGYRQSDAAYNVTVGTDFDRTDPAAVAAERRRAAGFESDGVAMLTAVSQRHARGARLGPALAVATAGLTNPATLPLDPDAEAATLPRHADRPPAGTVNLVVWTECDLADGTLATLLATVTEAKTATLQQATGFTGTTSDAVVVGCDPAGESATFAGSASEVGAAARACVREALRAAMSARAAESDPPESVADAEHGTVTDGRATVFEP